MFDIFAKLLSSVASFLFPLFASYKALKTGDTAQLTPWLMYWVVLACALLVESWTEWFLVWIPFYAYIRFLFLLYLVLPQTQGARFIYEEYIHPRLEENETAIEEFIASAHERLRSAGIAYLKRAIELLKTNVLGMPPSPPTAAAAPEPQTPQSYTQSLLARFTLPSPRWNATQHQPQASGGGLSADFYNLLASAVTSATSTTKPSQSATAAARSPLVIPESIRALGAPARMSFLQSQLERLRMVMSALEEAEEAARRGEGGAGHEHEEEQGGGASSSAARRSISGASVTSGLSKRSRSEGDFEKVEIFGSGDEGGQGGDDDDEGEGVRRRGVPQEAAAGAGGGGWIWGWGGGGGGGAGGGARSSGVEK